MSIRKKGGIRLAEAEDDSDESVSNDINDEEMRIKQQKEEAARKAKEEELWASFKKDTGLKAASKPTSSSKAPSTSSDSKISITRTYDFAGETVRVTKTVDSDSKEAKKAKKEEENMKTEANPAAKPIGSGGFKRSGGLSSVLGQISKKPKMSVLEKSKLDWDTFKVQEGIHDELQNFNKDGYLQKQAFLQRTDQRQFEMERDMRQTARKK